MTRLLDRFRYIQFLGLPVLKDNPDVRVDEFYVPMRFATHSVPAREAVVETTTMVTVTKFR